MVSNFKRAYELLISAPSISVKEYKSIPITTGQDYNTFNPYSGQVITGLQIRTSIKRSSKATASNKGNTVITVYNLNKDSRKILEAEAAIVVLKAGYEGTQELPIIFSGQVISVSTTPSKDGTVTEIIVGDAYTPQKNSRISKYYPPDTSKSNIIKDLVLNLGGVTEGVYAMEGLTERYYSSGYSAVGKVADILDSFCKSEGYEFIIENNRAYIRPKILLQETPDYTRIRQRSFVVKSSQIKRGVGRINNNSTDLSNTETTKAGYTFPLFLEGRIKVATLLQILDGEYQGIYKITGVTHTLDFRGQEWTTTVETEGI